MATGDRTDTFKIMGVAKRLPSICYVFFRMSKTGRCFNIIDQGETPPSDEDWMTICRDMMTLIKISVFPTYIVIFTAGGLPTPTQRKQIEQISEEMKEKGNQTKIAIVTTSMITRVVSLALRQFSEQALIACKEAGDAFDQLHLDQDEREAVVAAREMLQQAEAGHKTPSGP